ncbi:hypothetical protein [Winogradskyella schleiferi]|uniref:hypothetical protein n=1 Tax=Winogradskyella schleiferi TaxID=2686078 RepID=UPI0015BDCC84|nr:hypothetical protein [Winogradskyella schleiferi]
MHNKHLEDAYENFDYNSTTPIADLKSNLMAIDIPELTIEEKEDIINFVFENQIEGGENSLTDLDYLKQNLETQTAKDIVDSAYSSLNNLQYQSDFSNALIALKINASNSLTKSDLNSVLAYLEVLEQSSYFWKSTEFGGSGIGNATILNMQVYINGVTPCTKAIIGADGTGAATAVLSAGIGGWIAGTLNPGAMAAAVAIAAAAASVTASQTHYACQD